MTPIYLFDSCIFIAAFRNANPFAQDWLLRAARKNITASLSVITSYELWQGVGNQEELKKHKNLVADYQIFPLTDRIAQRAGVIWNSLPKEFHQNKKIHLDILIAATAEYHQLTIVTLNSKDFSRFKLQKARLIIPEQP